MSAAAQSPPRSVQSVSLARRVRAGHTRTAIVRVERPLQLPQQQGHRSNSAIRACSKRQGLLTLDEVGECGGLPSNYDGAAVGLPTVFLWPQSPAPMWEMAPLSAPTHNGDPMYRRYSLRLVSTRPSPGGWSVEGEVWLGPLVIGDIFAAVTHAVEGHYRQRGT